MGPRGPERRQAEWKGERRETAGSGWGAGHVGRRGEGAGQCGAAQNSCSPPGPPAGSPGGPSAFAARSLRQRHPPLSFPSPAPPGHPQHSSSSARRSPKSGARLCPRAWLPDSLPSLRVSPRLCSQPCPAPPAHSQANFCSLPREAVPEPEPSGRLRSGWAEGRGRGVRSGRSPRRPAWGRGQTGARAAASEGGAPHFQAPQAAACA